MLPLGKQTMDSANKRTIKSDGVKLECDAVQIKEEDVVLRHIRRDHPTTLVLAPSIEQPALVVQSPKSPKTPTLSRKLKAISLDSEPKRGALESGAARDVFSMPNTPKRHSTTRSRDIFDPPDGGGKLAPVGTNLKRFASNTSISGSQTLKTLPEIMMLHDFTSEGRTEPVRIKAKGLLERRGSNASLTIDLGSAVPEKPPVQRLNSAKSISTLNLTSFGTCFTSYYANAYRCEQCTRKVIGGERRTDTCGNCTIYESVPSKFGRKEGCHVGRRKCTCVCNVMGGRKSLSNENLYVPPCSLCLAGAGGTASAHAGRHCRGHRRACYPRQADMEPHALSDDFKMHLQNVQYLQTAGSVLSIAELRACCELPRVPKLHQEFWEVPLNLQEKCIVSGSQTRNRYRGVLPNEHSRVHLESSQPYIHANYIKGPDYTETAYIATQGPMAHTCDDFWQMVWQTNCDCIVMLTQLVEKGRNKCELYFPLGKSRSAPCLTSNSSIDSSTDTPTTIYAPFSLTSTTPPVNMTHKDSTTTPSFFSSNPLTKPLPNALSRTTSSSSSSSTSSGSSSLSTFSSSSSGTASAPEAPSVKASYYTIRTMASVLPDKFTFGYAHNPTSSGQSQFAGVTLEELVSYEELDDVQHGNFRVTFVDLEMQGDISVRTLRLTNLKTGEVRSIRHYWYSNWQDHKMAEPDQVLRLAINILHYMDTKRDAELKSKSSNNFNAAENRTINMVESNVATTRTIAIETKAETKVTRISKMAETMKSSSSRYNNESRFDFKRFENSLNSISISKRIESMDSAKEEAVGDIKTEVSDTDATESTRLQHDKSTVIVHCSAGIGRTGCFLAILNGIQQLRSNANVDVLAILCSLRLHRGGMVQTAEQYELIHRVLGMYAEQITNCKTEATK